MEKYYEMAAEYFQKVEGRHLYPKLISFYWLAWLVTMIGFAYFFCRFLFSIFTEHTPPSLGWMLSFEVAFIFSVIAIQIHKQNKLLESDSSTPIQKKKFKFLKTKHLRVQHLTTVVGKTAGQFADIAKEVTDLMKLEKSSRTIFDIEFRDVLRAVYDPESKARILSLLLALAALVVTLLKGSEVAPLADLIPEIDKKGGIAVFSFILIVKGALFFSALACAYVVMHQVYFVLTFWLSKFSWSQAGNQTMLNFMLRELVMLYDPTAKPMEDSKSKVEQPKEVCTQAPIPTVCIQSLPTSHAVPPITSLPALAAGALVLLGGFTYLLWSRKQDRP